MYIANIKNTYIRRIVLVVGFVPALVIGIVLTAGEAVWNTYKDLPDAIRSCWRRRK